MSAPSRRDVAFGAAFTALAAGSVLLRPRRTFARLPEAVLAQALPATVGPYRASPAGDFVLPPTDSLSSKLYDKVVTRLFVAPGVPPVMLLAAYGSAQNLTLELHRPEECYSMTGFDITAPRSAPLVLDGHAIPAAFLTARKPGRTEQLLFWSRIGHGFPATRRAQTLMVARENLAGRMPDGVLLRLSVIDERAGAAQAQLTGFMRMLGPALPPLGRQILLGEA